MPNLDQIPTRRIRRGDGGVDTDTTYAAGPPTSTYHRGEHIPTIDGSEGGFIGLLVGLLVLIIGCSIGIWLLLKRRRNEGRRPIPFFGKLVGGRSKQNGGAFGRLGTSDRRGWVRTNDGDDEMSDDEIEARGHGGAKRTIKLSNAPPRDRSAVQPTGGGGYSNDSNPFATPSSTRLQDQDKVGPYGDAFTTRPSTDSLDEAVHSSRYGGVPLHDPAETEESGTVEQRSPPVSPTFERGTKFREGF